MGQNIRQDFFEILIIDLSIKRYFSFLSSILVMIFFDLGIEELLRS